MANVIVFHSVLGIRKSILDFCKKLEKNGHHVDCVDLYDGSSFDDMQEALDHFFGIGIPEMMGRTFKYTQDLPHDAVYIGFSNGGASALLLAGTKPGAKGCILIHAALPIRELGIEKWPSDVPVEVHYAEADPWKEEESVTQLAHDITQSGASYQYHEYPIGGHLFTDAGMPEYHQASSDSVIENVLRFIDQSVEQSPG
jgi:dienelactone hydrolase